MKRDGNKNDVNLDAAGPALTIAARLSRRQILGLLLLPAALWLLWQLWVVAALLVLALIVAAGLEPAVSRLERRGLSRPVAVLGLYGVILGVLGSLGYGVGQVLAIQARSLMATLPALIARWQAGLGPTPDWLAGLSVRAAGYAGLAVQGVLAGLLVLLVAFYLLLDGRHL